MKADDPRCPECGAPVHLNSQSCGECGTRRGPQGWGTSAHIDGIDLPNENGEYDDDFDYQDFVAREFGEEPADGFLQRMTPKQRFWWLAALLTFIAFAILSFGISLF